jgi:hypothetical protein
MTITADEQRTECVEDEESGHLLVAAMLGLIQQIPRLERLHLGARIVALQSVRDAAEKALDEVV